MNIIRKGVPFALSMLAACASQIALAAPTSGAYITDSQNTWVQDRVGDRIGTVNMIMCVIGSMRADAMVNQGAYIALIDMGKCEGRGDSSKSTSSSAGASNASSFTSAVVTSTQATNDAPLVVKAWLHEEEEGEDGPQKMTIYVYVVATAGKSETNPNGLFSMYFCGSPDGVDTCMFSGSLKADNSGLSFYQNEGGHGGGGGGGGGSITQLKLQNNPTTESGLGRISGTEGGSPYNYSFAYNSNLFRRDDGTTDACFARDTDQGEYSTWRYGTYQSNGDRLESSNPGFAVKYEYNDSTYYGFWSFWGLWLPESAMADIALGNGTLTRRSGATDVPLEVVQKSGRLWRLTRHSSSLDDFKNVPMSFWTPTTMGSLQGGRNYEVKWDGEALAAVAEQVCDGGNCRSQALETPVVLDVATLASNHVKALSIFFPSGGGNGTISVPDTGDFSGSTTLYFRTREVVTPTNAPLNLDCLTQCPISGDALAAAFAGDTPSNPFTGSWGPSGTLSGQYTFEGGDLKDDNNDAALVDASGIDKHRLGNYQWGLTSGTLINHADVADVKCDMNGTPNTLGTNYCPGLMEQAAVVYQWETGPNQWNRYVGAVGLTIDPPKALSLSTHYVDADSNNNIRGENAADFNGNTVQLQFSGFGELQGIPGRCVDPDTNLPVQCGQNQRWVPAFDILDGTTVSEGSSNYYVKFLEREMRLKKSLCGGSAPSLSAASSLTLPTEALVDVNSRTTLGVELTPTSTKPSVIHGVVQTDE
jgi:hypothetical protein